jgi:hypothetical protein
MILQLGYLKPPSKAHRAYAKSLYERRSEAVFVPKIKITLPNWQPKPNECHDNCTELYLRQGNCEIIHGWVCVDASAIGFYRFVAHSVMKDETGSLFDITPSTIESELLFLNGNLNSDQYFEATDVLHEHWGVSNLDYLING